MRRNAYERDLILALTRFPKLNSRWSSDTKSWILQGEIDICDVKGDYWDTFNVAIFFPETYPHCVPIVIELSTLIERIPDRHISSDGVCCLDVDHKMQIQARKGISVFTFIAQKVYPYFANQLHFINFGRFAGEEYKHSSAGVIQFYAEDLNITDPAVAVKFLKKIIDNDGPERNQKCLCGNNAKVKKCHQEAIDQLKLVDRKQLLQDLKFFESQIP